MIYFLKNQKSYFILFLDNIFIIYYIFLIIINSDQIIKNLITKVFFQLNIWLNFKLTFKN